MVRKKTSISSFYRFMCIMTNGKQSYHIDFHSKEEVLSYKDNLDEANMEWYGIYEVDEVKNSLKLLFTKRIIPHKDTYLSKNITDRTSSSRNKRSKKSKV